MTEAERRQSFADLCRTYLGKKEADGSWRSILDLYNSMPNLPRGHKMTEEDPWCAAYVSAMAHKAGLLSIIPPECSCREMIRKFYAIGCFEEDDRYIPKVGDIVFYDWEGKAETDSIGLNTADHVGVVIGVSDKYISVIEGNKSDSVDLRALEIGSKYICGYGLPEYGKELQAAGCSSKETGKAESKPGEPGDGAGDQKGDAVLTEERVISLTTALLRSGSKNAAVKAAQALLNGLFDCDLEIDGEFGPLTEKAVIAAQKKYWPDKKSEWDGVIGSRTWDKMING